MITANLLRFGAVVIAIAAIVDPLWMRQTAVAQSLTIVAMEDDDLPSARRLQGMLRQEYDVRITRYLARSRASACPLLGACVVVSSRVVPQRLSAGAAVVGAVRTPPSDAVIIASVEAPRRVHRDAVSTLHVTLQRTAPRVDVFDGDALVGTAEAKGTVVDVPWVPIGDGARALRVVARGDSAGVGVLVDADAVPVLFYEPDTTWQGTFVRRALDDEARFSVRGRTRVAPPVTVTRGAASQLSADALSDVGTVIVTAPEALTAADVDLLERFVTRRGGSLIVLPDRRPSGPVMRLLPAIASERRENDAKTFDGLRATELLSFVVDASTQPLAGDPERQVVVSRALGRGRVIVSGALDAWRYRNDSAFNAFWTALVWDAAVAAGATVDVSPSRHVARAGEEVLVQAELQTLRDMPVELSAEGAYQCGETTGFIRLWPGSRPGMFDGVFAATEPGVCEVEVTIAGMTGRTSVTLLNELRQLPSESDTMPLDAIERAHGGLLVNAGQEAELADHVRSALPVEWRASPTRPMRSALWLFPFVACLAVEWWMRRRAGLK